MKVYLIKSFKSIGVAYGCKNLPIGTILGGVKCRLGLFVQHFYCRGHGETIPNKYFIQIVNRGKQY